MALDEATIEQARRAARHARTLRAQPLTLPTPWQGLPSPPGQPLPPKVRGSLKDAALSGRRIGLSAGHGYKWYDDHWGYQRDIVEGVREDTHTNQIMIELVLPALARTGAELFTVRERDYPSPELTADNDSESNGPGVDFNTVGAWSAGDGEGWNGGSYVYGSADAQGSQQAVWTFKLPAAGQHPVYVYFGSGTNRTSTAEYQVEHYAGTSSVGLDQNWMSSEQSGSASSAPSEWTPAPHQGWNYLGTFPFAADTSYRVTLFARGEANEVAVADALRVGSWQSGVAISGVESGGTRWEEGAWAFLSGLGAPKWVRTEDVTARPLYAAWRGVDAYFALHTNCCSKAGTSTWTWHPEQWQAASSWSSDFVATQLPPGTFDWASAIHSASVDSIREDFDPNWEDQGHWGSNFGELRPLRQLWKADLSAGASDPVAIPAALMEAAYHDGADNWAIREQNWRKALARGIVTGIIRYFNGENALVPPLPPRAPSLVRGPDKNGKRQALLRWTPTADALNPAATPAGYRVYLSYDGRLFEDSPSFTTTETQQLIPIADCDRVFARVTAFNQAGESLDSQVVGLRIGSKGQTRVLWVQGQDRLEVTAYDLSPVRDFAFIQGEVMDTAALSALGFASADDDAVASGGVQLPDYDWVVWSVGETGSRDGTLSAESQAALRSYLEADGRVLLSGSEIGWDLEEKGDAGSKAFFAQVLGLSYVADSAKTKRAEGVPDGALDAELAFDFGDCASDSYCVDYPDALAPTPKTTALLRYVDADPAGAVAAVLNRGSASSLNTGRGAVVTVGFPLETVTDPEVRVRLHQELLRALDPEGFPTDEVCTPGGDPTKPDPDGEGGSDVPGRPDPRPPTDEPGAGGDASLPEEEGCGCRLVGAKGRAPAARAEAPRDLTALAGLALLWTASRRRSRRSPARDTPSGMPCAR